MPAPDIISVLPFPLSRPWDIVVTATDVEFVDRVVVRTSITMTMPPTDDAFLDDVVWFFDVLGRVTRAHIDCTRVPHGSTWHRIVFGLRPSVACDRTVMW